MIFLPCSTASSYQNQKGRGYNNQIWSQSFPDSGESFYNNQYSNSIGSYDSAGSETNEVYSEEDSQLTPSAESSAEVIFSYNERDPYSPRNWGKVSRFCDGSSQSPVNINSVTTFRDRSSPLIIDGYNKLPSNITMTNSGHSGSMNFNFADGRPIRILGGPLSGSFILDNIHWHWGSSDNAGSEHTVNFRRLSAEMHLVTYSSKYRSLAEAQQQPKGLAVIAIFYEVRRKIIFFTQ